MNIKLNNEQATFLFEELVAKLFERAYKTSLLKEYFWQQNQEIYSLIFRLAGELEILDRYDKAKIAIDCLLPVE